ncbi:MAG: hypothetical protein K2P57_01260 [Burkholderiales bacterium]|nr:hypothetical protein [Burkholderiales bacterium]
MYDYINGYLESLGDGWSIYLWLIAGALIILACIYWIIWAKKNEQFDEDIKYVIFQEDDVDKMTREEYQKSREVIKTQIARREEVLEQERLKKQGSAT